MFGAGIVVGLLILVIALVGRGNPDPTTAGPESSPRATTPASPTPARPASTPSQSASPHLSPRSTSPSETATSRKPKPAPTKITTKAAPKPSASAKQGTALAAVATLPVKGRAPKTGYDRDEFGPAWADTDDNGCDTRDDVLNRDLSRKKFDGCVVLRGVLDDPYTGETIHFRRGITTSAKVQIDHLVAESDAWQKGAQQWTASKREKFANDTLNLLAVDGPENASKGDGDAATWLPPQKSFRCDYVAHQVAVKRLYGLWVTAAEKVAMQRVLRSCPTMKLPTRQAIPPHPATTSHPKHSTRPKTGSGSDGSGSSSRTGSGDSNPGSGSGSDQGVVHPGAFCAPAGATGHTAKGTPMECKTKPGDPRNRWRSAS
ncbi:DUF1524 domain-containing protein [Microlunatus elymi]|uniref:DUF1524 domain-containing protein n=2 Tax=Microlunatus elymi TaxID=2596828 RepID=A0A516Q5S0_9ACTN|nr:DUF1524 domain-containing protein [Microlunatus elymi]